MSKFILQFIELPLRLYPTAGMLERASQALNYCQTNDDCAALNIAATPCSTRYVWVNKEEEADFLKEVKGRLVLPGQTSCIADRVYTSPICEQGKCVDVR